MKYVVVFLTIVLSTLCAYITLDESIALKIRFFGEKKNTEEYLQKKISKKNIFLLTGLIFLCSLGAGICVLRDVSELINVIKVMVALVCIIGAACNDYREHRIPNFFSFVMALSGIVCLIVGYCVEQNGAEAYMVSSLIATVGVAVCMTLASILTNHGIGMGDIKLLCALALILGVNTICSTLFWGMLICAFVAIALLVTRKKDMQGALPFGPFVLIGYLICIFTLSY